jgi:hypothetical protein
MNPMAAKNICSEYLALPKDSPEHKRLRDELWLGGPDHACRYYMSILLGRDFFVLSHNELLKAVQEYVVAKSSAQAIEFCYSVRHFDVVKPFLRRECEIAEGVAGQRCIGKEEQGTIMLVQHPDWTDEQIRRAVNTTAKQMQRWTIFKAARVMQKRYLDG